MPSVLAYHRPGSLDEARTLLAESNTRAVAGGTVVVPQSRVVNDTGVSLVDLQGLGLDRITSDGTRLTIGAMVRLADLAADRRAPELLRDLACRELPSTLRNQATVGGTVALGQADSVLVAGLLVHDAFVSMHADPERSLSDLLTETVSDRLIVSVTIETDGHGAVAATGRTPADVPIVAAVGRNSSTARRLALTGVASTPIEVDPANPIAGLRPPGDFRGSSDYRRHLAATLSARVLAQLEGVSV